MSCGYLETEHFNTLAVANAENIKRSFESGSNVLDLDQVEFTLIPEGDSFYQDTKLKNRTTKIPPAKFDFVFGSGVRGHARFSFTINDRAIE